MKKKLNVVYSSQLATEMSIKMFSTQFTTMVLFTMEDLLLIRISRLQIHLFSLLVVFVNSQEDIRVLRWVDHSVLIDIMVEKWDQDLQEVYSISMIHKQIKKHLHSILA